MNNNELFEKHVINVMDSYCRYYDNVKKAEAEKSILADSIYDVNHTETFDTVLKKVMGYIANYLKIDINSISDEQIGRIRANLYVKYQYKFMVNQVVTASISSIRRNDETKEEFEDNVKNYIAQNESLIRYLQVFFVGGLNSYKNEDGTIKDIPVKEQVNADGTTTAILNDEQKEYFRKVYLEALVGDEFQKLIADYVRLLELQDKCEKGNIDESESKEMDILERNLAKCRGNMDLKTDCAFIAFNRAVYNNNEINNDRSLFKLIYHKELMNLINPLNSTRAYSDLVEGYIKEDDVVDLDKVDEIKTETGLFYGYLALCGHNDQSANVALPETISKLDGDNLDCLTMFDTYFKMYDQGTSIVDNLTKKM